MINICYTVNLSLTCPPLVYKLKLLADALAGLLFCLSQDTGGTLYSSPQPLKFKTVTGNYILFQWTFGSGPRGMDHTILDYLKMY